MTASSVQVTLSPGNASHGRSQEARPPPPVGGVKQQEKRNRWREVNNGRTEGPKEDPGVVRIRPPVSRKVTHHGTRPKLFEKYLLPKKTNEPSPLHLNKTRLVPGARRVWPSAMRKTQVPQKPKPTPENRTMPLILKDPGVEDFTPERSDATKPPVKPGTHQEGNRQGSITVAAPNKQPDAGTSASSSESSGSSPKQEKKCINKIKLTHIKLPHKDQRGSGRLTGDRAALVPQKTHPSSSDSGDTSDSSAVSDSDYSPDLFNKLLTDTLNNLNITTFSIGQSQPSNHSADSEAVGEQAFDGVRQPRYSPPAPLSPSTSPTPTYSVSTLPEMPTPPSHVSLNLSSEDKPSSAEIKEPRANIRRGSPEDKRQPMVQRSPAKSGFLRRPRPNIGPQNKVHLNSKSSHHASPPFNIYPGTQNKDISTLKVMTTASLPVSDESSSIEEIEQASDVRGHNSVATTRTLSEDEKKATPTETSRLTARHLPLRRGYMRRPIPNIGHFRNRTRPYVRILPGPFKPLKHVSDRSNQQLSPTELPATLSPPEEFNLAGSTKPREEEHQEVKTNVSTVLRQSTRWGASPYDPSARAGYFRRSPLKGGHLKNNASRNLKQPQRQHGEYTRNPFAFRWQTGGAALVVGNQPRHLQEDTTPETQGSELEKQTGPTPTQRVQHRQPEDTPGVQREGHGSNNSPHMDNLERGKHLSVQTTKPKEDLTKMPDLDADTDSHDEKVEDGKGSDDQTRPLARKPFSSPRQRSPKLVRPSVRVPLTRNSLLKKYISENPNRNYTKMNNTAKSLLFDSKTEPTKEAASKPQTRSDSSSSGVTREPLENVAVTNRTSKGFALTWDSPEGKYEKFVVTRQEMKKDEGPEQGRGQKVGEARNGLSAKESDFGNADKENRLNESVLRRATGDKPIQKVLAGSARTFQFAGLPPQTDYTVTLLGKGPGLLSRLHKLVISTGTDRSD